MVFLDAMDMGNYHTTNLAFSRGHLYLLPVAEHAGEPRTALASGQKRTDFSSPSEHCPPLGKVEPGCPNQVG